MFDFLLIILEDNTYSKPNGELVFNNNLMSTVSATLCLAVLF